MASSLVLLSCLSSVPLPRVASCQLPRVMIVVCVIFYNFRVPSNCLPPHPHHLHHRSLRSAPFPSPLSSCHLPSPRLLAFSYWYIHTLSRSTTLQNCSMCVYGSCLVRYINFHSNLRLHWSHQPTWSAMDSLHRVFS